MASEVVDIVEQNGLPPESRNVSDLGTLKIKAVFDLKSWKLTALKSANWELLLPFTEFLDEEANLNIPSAQWNNIV